MKTSYPQYIKGSLNQIEDKLSKTNKDILDEFILNCSTTCIPKKCEKIKRHILQFYDVTEIDLDKQDKKSVNGFLAVLNTSNRSGWTKTEIKTYIKKFLKIQYKDFGLIENIKISKRDKQTKISESDLITHKEFELMLSNTHSFKNKSYLTVAYESGARPQEILDLKWKDVIFEDEGEIVTLRLYSSKTGDTRTFPLKQSRDFLWYWKESYEFPNVKSEDYVFPSPRDRTKPVTSTACNKNIRKIAEKAGIQKRVWNYLFRHGRATRLYEELPQQIVEKLLGHKDMAHVYAHISDKKARQELISKIYKIENLPENEKTKLNDEVKTLKSQLEIAIKVMNLTHQKEMGEITQEEYVKERNNLIEVVS